MEPNDPSKHQGRGTQSPPQSPPQAPPLSGTSSQQMGTSGSEGSSRPGGKADSSAGGVRELGNEAIKAAKAKAKEGADTAKRTVSDTVSHSAEALDRAAKSLRDQGEETLAKTTTSIASGLSEYADRLEQRTPEDLMQDLVRLARQNPTVFVLGSVGVGIALSRFFKASSRPSDGLS